MHPISLSSSLRRISNLVTTRLHSLSFVLSSVNMVDLSSTGPAPLQETSHPTRICKQPRDKKKLLLGPRRVLPPRMRTRSLSNRLQCTPLKFRSCSLSCRRRRRWQICSPI
ncbi:hypothetical protein O6H91_02G021900 [Diphasiastrum complanatum]|uniref:Uncharacterized protein n=1 Tax=Diphasiastrum complanatum TaxID=34168 RepID=A0ACC2EDN7_DIPCM|nr:hypothetical protein O6H91_02G021900 [Diphasiastrum complanatum]